MDEENIIKTDRLSDDALIIYCDEYNKIRFCGDPKFLGNKDHYIKVSILKGIFTITSCEKVDLSSNRCMYFPSLTDCDFKRFIMNYLISMRVPGIYLLDIGDLFIDMKYTAENIDKYVKDRAILPQYDDEPQIISDLMDLYYMSDYSDQSYQVKWDDYLIFQKLISDSMNKLRNNPDIAVQVDDLKKYFDTFIEIVTRGEFRNGYTLGRTLTNGILTTPPGSIRFDDHDEWADDETDEEESE